MTRRLVILWFLLLLSTGLTAPALALQGDYASRFVRTLSLDSGTLGEAVSLVYGNAEYGYFETKELSEANGKISVRFVPPGYRIPLALYLKQRDQNGEVHFERLADIRFPHPLGAQNPGYFPVEGTLSSPFFLGNAEVSVGSQFQPKTAFIVNRQGEIVWMYLGPKQGTVDIVKPLGGGRYSYFSFRKRLFEVADFGGAVIRSVPHGKLTPHHDCIYDGGDRLISFSRRALEYPGAAGSMLVPDRYSVGQVVLFDLKTMGSTLLWDAFDDGPMLYGPGWVENPEDVKPVQAGAGEAPARRDFDHINSVDWSPGRGYIVSIRNFSTVVLLDEAFRLKWSLGSAPSTTMSTKGTPAEFHRQHHATFLPNGDILLFDNGQTRSRLLQFRVDDQSHSFSLVREYLPRDPLHTPFRGSASRLPNGNTIGFFLESGSTWGAVRVVEFDNQGTQTAMLTIPDGVLREGARAIPIDTIGKETYLGLSPSRTGLR